MIPRCNSRGITQSLLRLFFYIFVDLATETIQFQNRVQAALRVGIWENEIARARQYPVEIGTKKRRDGSLVRTTWIEK